MPKINNVKVNLTASPLNRIRARAGYAGYSIISLFNNQFLLVEYKTGIPAPPRSPLNVKELENVVKQLADEIYGRGILRESFTDWR